MEKHLDKRQQDAGVPIIPLIALDSIQTRYLAQQISKTCGCKCILLPPRSGLMVALNAVDASVILLDMLMIDSSDDVGELLRRLPQRGPITILLNATSELRDAFGDRVITLDISSNVGAVAQEVATWLPDIDPTTGEGGDLALQEALTYAELRVLDRLRFGHTNDGIADHLSLSPHTVKTHLYNIYQKLGCKNRSEAALWANRCLVDSSSLTGVYELPDSVYRADAPASMRI